jgi:hypothetical protein
VLNINGKNINGKNIKINGENKLKKLQDKIQENMAEYITVTEKLNRHRMTTEIPM